MSKTPRRWLQPELWLVIGIPAATVVGGMFTLWLATRDDLSDDGESEGAQQTAQMQTAELGPDMAALQRGLQGELQLDRAGARVHVSLRGDDGAPQALQLRLLHPMQAGRDVDLQLQRQDDEWSAALPAGVDQRWRLVLTDSARTWRLVGRLPAGASVAQLRPALPAP